MTKTYSLKEKIAQLFILGFDGKAVDEKNPIVEDILSFGLGGVILFDYHFKTKTFDKNIGSPTQVHTLSQKLQHYQQQTSPLPLFVSIDYEGGHVNRLKEEKGFVPTVSPQKIAMLSKDEAKKIMAQMANQLADLGINLNFMPCLDVNINKDNPVIGQLARSYSASPDVVTHFSRFMVQSLKQKNILSAFKHFPGHGSAINDSHLGFVDVTDTWQEKELIPYKNLIASEDCADFVMSAHIVNKKLDANGVPATLSPAMLTDLLRRELKFNGLIISDDMQMKAMSDYFSLKEMLIKGVHAGLDMFIFGNQLSKEPIRLITLIEIIEGAINNGDLTQAQIDNAFSRIVNIKSSMLSFPQS